MLKAYASKKVLEYPFNHRILWIDFRSIRLSSSMFSLDSIIPADIIKLDYSLNTVLQTDSILTMTVSVTDLNCSSSKIVPSIITNPGSYPVSDIHLEWKNLTVKANVTRRRQFFKRLQCGKSVQIEEKFLLHNLSGIINGGLWAIMGMFSLMNHFFLYYSFTILRTTWLWQINSPKYVSLSFG